MAPAASRSATMLPSCFGLAILAVALATGEAPSQPEPARQLVVIPFDFESRFDHGRYGRMVGDSIWKKLERQGGFVIPESMLDVRDWEERTKTTFNHETPLEQVGRAVRQDFQADIGIWGKIERVPGSELDIYDLWICIADFSAVPPRILYRTQARTKTVSEIPHLYLKEGLDKLAGRRPEEAPPADQEREQRWKDGPNLVKGDFERGSAAPEGWDPLPSHVSRVVVPTEQNPENRVIRFQFPASVAESTGVLYYSDFFPIEAQAVYRFQCRWRTTGSSVKVFIKCYDELPSRFAPRGAQGSEKERRVVYRSQQNLKGPARTWNVHTEDFTPQHTQYTPQWGRVMLYAYWPPGAVDFDDVIVKQICPPPAQQPPRQRRPSLETKVLSEEIEKAKGRKSK